MRSLVDMIRKELQVEWRSKELVVTMVFFASVLLVVFSVGFIPQGATEIDQGTSAVRAALPAILWVSIAFAGTLGLNRSFARELEGDTIRALLISPVPRWALLGGKVVSLLLFLLVVEVVLVFATMVLFEAPFSRAPGIVAAILALGTLGFSVIGCAFSAMLMRARAKGILLPVVLFPVLMPLFLATTKGTTAALTQPVDTESAQQWIQFLIGFDILFLVAALWIFESLIVE